MTFSIRTIQPKDWPEIREILTHFWGAPYMVAHGVLFYPSHLQGFAAVIGDRITGILHLQIDTLKANCEIITLASLQENQGIGTALIRAAARQAREEGCRKLRLITTNDNLKALRFYQKRGFRIRAVFPDQVDISRKLKPDIPERGQNGIPLKDEILLEKDLT
jgi:GNAT superfamily N-acetyltransferase